jgi:hypothetical protein
MKNIVCVIATGMLLNVAAPVRGITTDDLAGICQAMESAIQDVSVSYQWYVCPPAKIGDLPKSGGTSGPRLIAKGPETCIWVAKQPFGERYLSITKVTTVSADGESFDNTLMYSCNGEVAKYLNCCADAGTKRSFPPDGSVSGASAFVAPLPLSHTPMLFSVLYLSLDDARIPLSRSLRKKGFVDVNEGVRKINGFNTVCASLLLDTPAIPAADKRPYLRICFSVDHGYTPVKYERLSPDGRLNFAVDVNSLTQVAKGSWFPTGGSLAIAGSNLRNVYKAGKVAVNRGLTDRYFTIEFPPGTRVNDQITGSDYAVKPGASRFDQWLQSDEWLRQADIVGKKKPESQDPKPK